MPGSAAGVDHHLPAARVALALERARREAAERGLDALTKRLAELRVENQRLFAALHARTDVVHTAGAHGGPANGMTWPRRGTPAPHAPAPTRVPITVLDRDLVASLSERDRRTAERFVRAPVHTLPAGPLIVDILALAGDGGLGVLIVDGLLVRTTRRGAARATDLFGSQDVLPPATGDDADEIWTVAAPARVAILDRAFAHAATRIPALSQALIARALHHAQALPDRIAITTMTRVDDRLLAVFCHAAERWGRVTPAGVTVHLPLTHRMLGDLIGARRPSVTTALTKLHQDGLVSRDGDDWHIAIAPERLVAAPGTSPDGRASMDDAVVA